MMTSTSKTASFLPTRDQIGMLSGIVLVFLWEVLKHYTQWDWRVCIIVAALPVWVAQGFLFKTPPKKWAIQIGVSVAISFFGWELLSLVWK